MPRPEGGMSLKSYSLLLGANNARRYFAARDEKLLRAITARWFPDGFTILNAKGSWYDATARTFRREDAREVLVCTDRPRRLWQWCRELGIALRQKELLLIELGTTKR